MCGADHREFVDRDATAAAALGMRGLTGMLTTSDFPQILQAAGRVLLAHGYTAAPRTFTGWCGETTVTSYKPEGRVPVGLGPSLLQVLKHGEYSRSTFQFADLE